MEERLKSKYLYKLFLILLRYTPILLIINEILYSVFAYFNYECKILNYISGFSLYSILYLYITSYIFKFCNLYRLSITSTVIVNLIAIYDENIGISLDNLQILRVYLIILLTGLICYIKFYVKYNKKHTT